MKVAITKGRAALATVATAWLTLALGVAVTDNPVRATIAGLPAAILSALGG